MAGSVSTTLWSNIYYLYMAIALVVGGLVAGWCLYSMWRYRARPGQKRPADAPRAGYITRERGHVLGAYVMAGAIAAIMFGLAFSTIDAINIIEHPPENEPAVHIDVVGFQFGWQFRYYGEYTNTTSGQVETFSFTSVNDLRVPVDTVVTANVTSRDVQHVFGIPDYRIQIYASPGNTLPIWWKATETGKVPINCLRNCGVGHNDMIKAATLTVLTKEEFATYMASKAPKQQAAEATTGGTSARTLLLEDGQAVTDESTVPAHSTLDLTFLNRETKSVTFSVGPADAPWATQTVAPGEEARLTVTTPATGTFDTWALPQGATTPELLHTYEVKAE